MANTSSRTLRLLSLLQSRRYWPGAELAGRLERNGLLVAPGGPLGADDHVRAAIRGAAATERQLSGLTQALQD